MKLSHPDPCYPTVRLYTPAAGLSTIWNCTLITYALSPFCIRLFLFQQSQFHLRLLNNQGNLFKVQLTDIVELEDDRKPAPQDSQLQPSRHERSEVLSQQRRSDGVSDTTGLRTSCERRAHQGTGP